MKAKVLIKISDNIPIGYLNSLKITLSKTNKVIREQIEFEFQKYKFEREEIISIEKSPDSFLTQKLANFNFNYSTIIYIPTTTINLKGK